MDRKIIFVFLIVIFSLKYFDATIAASGVLKNLSYAFMLLSVIISIPFFFKYRGGFVLPVQLICFSILFSIFLAKYTWGQGLEYSATTLPYLCWFFYFYLLSSNLSVQVIEKIVLIYGILYIILFLFQFTHNGVLYFGYRDLVMDRGVIRIIFPGGGVFFLSCFIAINKVTSTSKFKYLWGAFALIGIVIVIMQVTRQQIFFMLLFYLVHFLRNVKLHYKIITVVMFVASAYLFINSDNPISRGLVEQQKTDTSAGGDYIRVLGAKYFLSEFTPNDLSKLFGNGFPNDTSPYGKRLAYLSENYGYYLTDFGLIEVYICFGIFAVIGYLIIFYKSITIPLPADQYYLKYYLWFVLCTSLTSDALISYSFLITTVFALYCYHRIIIEEKLFNNVLIDSKRQLMMAKTVERRAKIRPQ